MKDIEFLPDRQDETTLPVKREVLYTTVHRDGKQALVPYDPGKFDLTRGLEFFVAGSGVAVMLVALQNGNLKGAVVCAVLALFEFLCGMTRPGGRGLGRFLQEDETK